MLDVGFVGWRGMVGSVLLERMWEEGDFSGLAPAFYSTSAPGGPGPAGLGFDTGRLGDAHEVGALARHDVIITCQGGDYTKEVHPRLRSAGWNGYWIDAASALRMEPGTVLALDPVNADAIAGGLARGRRDFCGANCTVSLMLMALAGLFKAGLVEWMTSMTYQAASGAGAAHMRELASQMAAIGEAVREPLADPASSALVLDRSVRAVLADDGFPQSRFGAPLAASLLPWIDRPVGDGRSREEGKGFEEGNKILGSEEPVPIDGVCVRIGSMRCHAQAFHRQAPRGPAPGRDRGSHRQRARLGAGGREHPGGDPRRAHPGRGERTPRSCGRPGSQARDGRGVPHRVFGRRPAPLGSGRAPSPDARHPAEPPRRGPPRPDQSRLSHAVRRRACVAIPGATNGSPKTCEHF